MPYRDLHRSLTTELQQTFWEINNDFYSFEK